MSDLLYLFYPWVKSLHIISVIAWMAGLFYLPRIFVYHVERAEEGDKLDATFQIMERKLFRLIMVPSMIASWFFGLILMSIPGVVEWGSMWPWAKAFSVIGMTLFHFWLGWKIEEFSFGENTLTGRQYRLMNEVPTILMIIIVLSVIVRF